MKVNRKIEKTAKAWGWRAMFGPSLLLDGLFQTFTLGTLSLGVSLEVSRRLAMVRFESMKENTHD